MEREWGGKKGERVREELKEGVVKGEREIEGERKREREREGGGSK